MQMIQGMGFNWVKQQVEWSVFEGAEGARDFRCVGWDRQRGQRRGHQRAL